MSLTVTPGGPDMGDEPGADVIPALAAGGNQTTLKCLDALESADMAVLVARAAANGVADPKAITLQHLTRDNLQRWGVAIGPRNRIVAAAAKGAGAGEDAKQPAPAVPQPAQPKVNNTRIAALDDIDFMDLSALLAKAQGQRIGPKDITLAHLTRDTLSAWGVPIGFRNRILALVAAADAVPFRVACAKGAHQCTEYKGGRIALSYAPGSQLNCDVCAEQDFDTQQRYAHCDVCKDWDACPKCTLRASRAAAAAAGAGAGAGGDEKIGGGNKKGGQNAAADPVDHKQPPAAGAGANPTRLQCLNGLAADDMKVLLAAADKIAHVAPQNLAVHHLTRATLAAWGIPIGVRNRILAVAAAGAPVPVVPVPAVHVVRCSKKHHCTIMSGGRIALNYAPGSTLDCDVCGAKNFDTKQDYAHCDICRNWDACPKCTRRAPKAMPDMGVDAPRLGRDGPVWHWVAGHVVETPIEDVVAALEKCGVRNPLDLPGVTREQLAGAGLSIGVRNRVLAAIAADPKLKAPGAGDGDAKQPPQPQPHRPPAKLDRDPGSVWDWVVHHVVDVPLEPVIDALHLKLGVRDPSQLLALTYEQLNGAGLSPYVCNQILNGAKRDPNLQQPQPVMPAVDEKGAVWKWVAGHITDTPIRAVVEALQHKCGVTAVAHIANVTRAQLLAAGVAPFVCDQIAAAVAHDPNMPKPKPPVGGGGVPDLGVGAPNADRDGPVWHWVAGHVVDTPIEHVVAALTKCGVRNPLQLPAVTREQLAGAGLSVGVRNRVLAAIAADPKLKGPGAAAGPGDEKLGGDKKVGQGNAVVPDGPEEDGDGDDSAATWAARFLKEDASDAAEFTAFCAKNNLTLWTAHIQPLTRERLAALGMPIGRRNRLLAAIAKTPAKWPGVKQVYVQAGAGGPDGLDPGAVAWLTVTLSADDVELWKKHLPTLTVPAAAPAAAAAAAGAATKVRSLSDMRAAVTRAKLVELKQVLVGPRNRLLHALSFVTDADVAAAAAATLAAARKQLGAGAAAGPAAPGGPANGPAAGVLLKVPPRKPAPPAPVKGWNGLVPGEKGLPQPNPPETKGNGLCAGWKICTLHFEDRVVEDAEVEKVDDVNCKELLDLCKACNIPQETFKLWGNFNRREDLISPLESVVNHAETSTNTTPGLKNKLRYVTKKIKENNGKPAAARDFDPAGIYVMLATHGNMCNIQKEVGIGVAYSMVNNTLKSDMDKKSMQQLIVKLLFNFRMQVMEEMYLKHGRNKNNHNLNAMSNDLHAWNGLPVVPDDPFGPDSFREVQVTPALIDDWYARYSPETMVKHLSAAVNGKHKKIPYDTTVRWYQDHAPPGVDPYEFLSEVFDEDTGLVKDKWLLYLLHAHYAVEGPGVLYQPAAAAAAVPPAGDKKDEKVGGPPQLVRQTSAHMDLKMPPMIRKVSLFEEQLALAQEESLKAVPLIGALHAANILAAAVIKGLEAAPAAPAPGGAAAAAPAAPAAPAAAAAAGPAAAPIAPVAPDALHVVQISNDIERALMQPHQPEAVDVIQKAEAAAAGAPPRARMKAAAASSSDAPASPKDVPKKKFVLILLVRVHSTQTMQAKATAGGPLGGLSSTPSSSALLGGGGGNAAALAAIGGFGAAVAPTTPLPAPLQLPAMSRASGVGAAGLGLPGTSNSSNSNSGMSPSTPMRHTQRGRGLAALGQHMRTPSGSALLGSDAALAALAQLSAAQQQQTSSPLGNTGGGGPVMAFPLGSGAASPSANTSPQHAVPYAAAAGGGSMLRSPSGRNLFGTTPSSASSAATAAAAAAAAAGVAGPSGPNAVAFGSPASLQRRGLTSLASQGSASNLLLLNATTTIAAAASGATGGGGGSPVPPPQVGAGRVKGAGVSLQPLARSGSVKALSQQPLPSPPILDPTSPTGPGVLRRLTDFERFGPTTKLPGGGADASAPTTPPSMAGSVHSSAASSAAGSAATSVAPSPDAPSQPFVVMGNKPVLSLSVGGSTAANNSSSSSSSSGSSAGVGGVLPPPVLPNPNAILAPLSHTLSHSSAAAVAAAAVAAAGAAMATSGGAKSTPHSALASHGGGRGFFGSSLPAALQPGVLPPAPLSIPLAIGAPPPAAGGASGSSSTSSNKTTIPTAPVTSGSATPSPAAVRRWSEDDDGFNFSPQMPANARASFTAAAAPAAMMAAAAATGTAAANAAALAAAAATVDDDGPYFGPTAAVPKQQSSHSRSTSRDDGTVRYGDDAAATATSAVAAAAPVKARYSDSMAQQQQAVYGGVSASAYTVPFGIPTISEEDVQWLSAHAHDAAASASALLGGMGMAGGGGSIILKPPLTCPTSDRYQDWASAVVRATRGALSRDVILRVWAYCSPLAFGDVAALAAELLSQAEPRPLADDGFDSPQFFFECVPAPDALQLYRRSDMQNVGQPPAGLGTSASSYARVSEWVRDVWAQRMAGEFHLVSFPVRDELLRLLVDCLDTLGPSAAAAAALDSAATAVATVAPPLLHVESSASSSSSSSSNTATPTAAGAAGAAGTPHLTRPPSLSHAHSLSYGSGGSSSSGVLIDPTAATPHHGASQARPGAVAGGAAATSSSSGNHRPTNPYGNAHGVTCEWYDAWNDSAEVFMFVLSDGQYAFNIGFETFKADAAAVTTADRVGAAAL